MKSGTTAAAATHKVLTQIKLPVHVRKLAFTTEIQPVVTYAAQVWAQPTQSLRKKLESWQMGLVTRAFHCHAKTSHICLQQELGMFPLHVTCDTLALRYWHHRANATTDRLLYKIHTAWEGKYHPGDRTFKSCSPSTIMGGL